MADSTPLVSVVIPCKNRAHLLAPTLDSIFQQDYSHIECFVADGGSTDGTIELLSRYGDRLTWVSERDRGPADAINKGWQRCSGEIVAWLNADDLWATPGAISQVVHYLQAHPEVDVVYGDCGLITINGKILPKVFRQEWNLEYAVEHCEHIIHQPAAFFRRRILERVNWLDIGFKAKHDHELWLRIGLAGTIHRVPTILAYGRTGPGYMSQRGDIEAETCIQLTEKFFSLPNIPESIKAKQTRAFSNAYFQGIYWAFKDGQHWPLIWRFLGRALTIDPANLAGALRCFIRCSWEFVKLILKRIVPSKF